jgi:hypothetical protein
MTNMYVKAEMKSKKVDLIIFTRDKDNGRLVSVENDTLTGIIWNINREPAPIYSPSSDMKRGRMPRSISGAFTSSKVYDARFCYDIVVQTTDEDGSIKERTVYEAEVAGYAADDKGFIHQYTAKEVSPQTPIMIGTEKDAL